MTVTPTNYNIRKSLEGNLLGLDASAIAPLAIGGAANPKGAYAPYLMGRDFMGLRIFPAGSFSKQGMDYKECVRLSHNDVFDDFLGAAVSNFWNSRTGSDGSCAVAIHVANNGTVRLTTGAGSTHTMAVNGAQIVGAVNNLVADGALRMETRLGNLSAATSQSICFGLVDSSALSAPFTLTAGTVTANATNGACFLQDAAGTNTALNCVSVNAGGTPQVTALTNIVNVTSGKENIYRVEIDAAGNALFFIDGTLVASQLLAVATTALLAPSVGMFSEATSGSQTLDIDYILNQSLRV